MAPALKRVCDLRLLTRRFQSLLRNECRPLKADSTFPLCFPGTYLPGYLDAAAARLVHGFIPLTVISPSFVTGAEGPLFHRAPLFCAEVPLFHTERCYSKSDDRFRESFPSLCKLHPSRFGMGCFLLRSNSRFVSSNASTPFILSGCPSLIS